MSKAYDATLARILGPLAAFHLRPVDDSDVVVTRPEPEVLGIVAYHQAIVARNLVAAFATREQLKMLEIDTLLTLAESHATLRRARAVKPMIGYASA